ncbi:hypothetical protein TSAR_005180 [Trichomalopsis sarcophagae]|uniref:ATP-dependent RNA helicase n=1 Tax=Trichomalopsis sarcophagae TaxID=543379 RepID=A0A232F1T7_9HYME|nr:hypothetical protein TSAR_005180 [Trichomalopsis sarcophagae]
MVVMEDNDICLNIVTGIGSAKKQKQSPKITSDLRIKRLSTNPADGTRKPFQKFQSTESSKSLLVGAKKRIKQKSLANIVANNLKKVSQPAEPPKTSILKKLVSGNKKTSASSAVAKETKSEKEKRVSFSQNKEDAPGETLVQFTKPTKENALKTILAKKRKSDTGEPKKSLSSIFKTSSSTDSNLLKNSNNVAKEKTDTKFTNDKQKAGPTHSNTVSFNSESNPIKKFKKSRDKVDKFNKNNGEKKEMNERPRPQQGSGKISSLFGHNPTIPNIGQRFVKPVNEKVFSAEKFGDLGIHAYAVQNLEQNMKITTMTTVQKKAIPVILSGKDVLVRSQTGSGKTLAYALPIIETLQRVRPKLARDSGIKALVVVPTRELALQTYECFLKLVKPFTWIVPGYLVGGEKRKAEKARLRKGCTVLVATPGRLLDHIKHTQALRLDLINCFVLDEADRMLDMGYEKDISGIVAALENNLPASDNSGYDPMQMLRQRVNPEAADQNKSEEEEGKRIENNEEDNSDEERKIITKQQYNSDSEEEPDDEADLKKSEPASSNIEENDDRPHKRQTILLSATLTQAVEKLAGLTMHNPAFVDAAKENVEAVGGNLSEINDDLVVPESVAQSYIVTPPKLRMVTLSAYIAGRCQAQGSHKILVFMATQDMIDYHAEVLSTVLNKPVDEEDEDSEPLVDVEFFKLHGSMTQKERTEIFKTFRAAKSGVLLCTDVAARGLDLPKVDTVVQYTGPTSTRDYVHRIGRTARAGTSGVSTIFLTPPEVEFARMLEKHRIRIKQEDMDDVLAKLLGPLSPHNSVHAAAIALQNDFENLVLENKRLYTAACKAYTSWVRFYSSYPREMREVFNRKDLHLGHYAKSFALREPPQKIGAAGKSIREREQSQLAKPKHQNRLSNQRNDGVSAGNNKRRAGQAGTGGASQRQQDRRTGMLKNVRMLNTSEYDSGLEPIKKPKKS